jgi:hypothetical protein
LKTFTRRRLYFIGITAAAFVGASSVAFACLTTKGQITLTTKNGVGDTVKGTGVMHGFCYDPTVEATAISGGTVKVEVAPTTCGGGQLVDRTTWEVRLGDDTASAGANAQWRKTGGVWVWQNGKGCWSGVTSYKVLTTTFTVSGGSGSGTYKIPTNAGVYTSTTSAAGICIGDGTNGNFAPLRITG